MVKKKLNFITVSILLSNDCPPKLYCMPKKNDGVMFNTVEIMSILEFNMF